MILSRMSVAFICTSFWEEGVRIQGNITDVHLGQFRVGMGEKQGVLATLTTPTPPNAPRPEEGQARTQVMGLPLLQPSN